MSLDLFGGTQDAVLADASRHLAADLPAGFGETLDIAWRRASEWNSALAESNARERALASYYDDVKARAGVQLPLYGLGGAVTLDDLNKKIGEIADKDPEGGWLPLSEDDIATMTRRRMAAAHDDAKALDKRETTWGGTAGTVLGTLWGGIADPVTLATLPLGLGEAGILLRAAEFAGLAAGTEAINAASSFQAREAAVPGSSREIPGEIAGAAAMGGAIGGAFGALGKLLGAGRRPLLTEARDDLNVATSEAQLAAGNPFPTVAGEAAHRDAVSEALTALAKGERVTAGDAFPAAHVGDLATASGARTIDDLALAAERDYRPLSHADMPDVERFDAMPQAGEDAASYWERRLAEASPEERAAMGATDAAPFPVAPRAIRERVSIGPSSFETTPLLGKTVWHETSPDAAAKLFAEDATNYVDGVWTSNIFVADNKDIAIGQGGSGVKIEFSGNLVSAIEHRKPGTGDLTGREYRVNAIASGAINAIELQPGVKLPLKPSMRSRFDAEFIRADLPDGSVRYERKSAPAPTPAADAAARGAVDAAFDTTREFWHGTTRGKFTEFRDSAQSNDVLGPAVYLSASKSGAEFYGPGRGGELLGPWHVRGNIVTPETMVRLNSDGSGPMAPAGILLGKLKHALTDARMREPWGRDMSGAEYAREFWKRRGVDGYSASGGAEVAIYDPNNIRAGFRLEPDTVPQQPRVGAPAARDLSPEEVAKLAADPETESAVLRDLDRFRVSRPDAVYTEAVRLDDGSYRLDARPLEQVMDELDAIDGLGKELQACATGLMAAE
ncbi:hypothetical protein IP86_02960 [Rhodopseudomonas sp. AAP120]|uniref:hypothetical protein n=1 Tax=Rhodopseudomonas sp. AAP120 TaxID=1523430 RepID=UPI0006B94F91|nr:hypothetical protein [Rhodopseudomonas sp. AAP120]KPG01784.1 hypothetical protein IP86_02960 [Rhodopseudomonas sp. AAP120]